MSEHLPVLQVVVPLVSAPLCLLLRRGAFVRWWSVAVALTCLVIASTLLTWVRAEGVISYHIGGWAPPLGIEYRIDLLNAYVLVLVSAVAAVVLPFGLGSAAHTVPPDRQRLFYAAFLLCLTGLLGMTITGDAFNVFVFLEIASLSSYALVALGQGRRALVAAFSYLIVGTIGGTFFLIGVGLAYQLTGTLNMADLAARLAEGADVRTLKTSFAFVTIGLAIKLAVFPLHQWLPNAYTCAPSTVSAFLASTATKVSYYVLVRMIFGVFGAAFVFETMRFELMLGPLSIAAMLIGSLSAIFQVDVKRLLAYSSIAQIGYMTLGLSLHSEASLTGGIVHLFNHAMIKGALFLAVACSTFRVRSSRVDDLAGLARRMPLTFAAIVVGGLSLIGVPGTVGFVSKWYLVVAALEQGHWGIALLVLVASLLAVAYVWRIVEVGYFREAHPDFPAGKAPLGMIVPTWIFAGACIYFGLHTDLTVGVASRAAEVLLSAGGAP